MIPVISLPALRKVEEILHFTWLQKLAGNFVHQSDLLLHLFIFIKTRAVISQKHGFSDSDSEHMIYIEN